jgi:hypothetical protein
MPIKPAYTWRRVILGAAIVVAGSILIGALTSPAQQYLPAWINSIANSAGGWSMFAFLLVWLSRARPVLGGILGAVSFVLMVESYGVASGLRGFAFSPLTMWVPIGLVAGPILGVAAALTRNGARAWIIAGVGVLSLVLVAEGLYGLLVISATTSPVYWSLEIAAGIVFVIVAIILTRSRGEDAQPTLT